MSEKRYLLVYRLVSYSRTAFYQGVIRSQSTFGYQVPWVCDCPFDYLPVGVLISAIMRYSVKQVEKQNIIETIRSENICLSATMKFLWRSSNSLCIRPPELD